MINTFNEYGLLALRTAKTEIPGDILLNNAALGLAGEAGEVADIIKKVQHHEHPFTIETREKLIKELGDILWYINLASFVLETSLEEIAATNIEKLQGRYPEGFSTERSLNRAE